MNPRIRLLSPAPIRVNPRLVKEADALHEAGDDVIAGIGLTATRRVTTRSCVSSRGAGTH